MMAPMLHSLLRTRLHSFLCRDKNHDDNSDKNDEEHEDDKADDISAQQEAYSKF